MVIFFVRIIRPIRFLTTRESTVDIHVKKAAPPPQLADEIILASMISIQAKIHWSLIAGAASAVSLTHHIKW